MRFCGQCGSPLPQANVATPPLPTLRSTEERRQITVAFFDLVGSTALSDRLDPEDYRELLNRYHRLVAREVERLDGRVAQYLGDGVMVYFGHPRTREDATERAVRSALAVTAELERVRQESGEPLHVRIGIHTGLVVVAQGGGKHALALGSTPNVAARLQSLARQDTIVISDATRRMLRHRLEITSLGTQSLKGIAKPVEAFEVQHGQRSDSEWQAERFVRSRMVDRNNERSRLAKLWQQARDGNGMSLLVVGEPGIGKSRLIEHFLDTEVQGARELVASCSPRTRDSALSPVAALMENAIGSGLDAETRRKALEQEAEQAALPASAVNVLSELLAPSTEDTLELTPNQLRQQTLTHLADWLTGLSRRDPLVAVLEDLHWADPSTLEWLTLLQQQLEQLPILLLVTARDGGLARADWQPSIQLELRGLASTDAREMIDSLAGDLAVPARTEARLLAQSDGVPLYIEELVQTVSDRLSDETADEAGEGKRSTVTDWTSAVPSTLHDLLMARLDRLGQERELVRWTATIGRQFDRELLAAVTRFSPERLHRDLETLCANGILEPLEHGRFQFRQALVQETAYQALLRTDRASQHSKIADFLLERRQQGTTDPVPAELLGHHLSAGQRPQEALPWWHAAGELALRRSANLEAIAHLERARDCAPAMVETAERTTTLLRIESQRAAALVAVKGYGSAEVSEAYSTVSDLARASGDPREIFVGLRGVLPFYLVRSDHQNAFSIGEELVALARTIDEPAFEVEARLSLATACFWLGEVRASLEQAEQALASDSDATDPTVRFRFGQDPVVLSQLYISWCRWWLGEPGAAIEAARTALARARAADHAHTLVLALDHAGALALYLRDAEWARQLAREQQELAEQHDFEMWVAMSRYRVAFLDAVEGRPEPALEIMRRSIAAFRATGALIAHPLHLYHLATACRSAGLLEEAIEVVEQAVDNAEKGVEAHWTAELYRLHGELLLKRDPTDPRAHGAVRKAVAEARRRGSTTLELRALTSLLRTTGSDSTRTALSALVSNFPSELEIPDLTEARQALLG